MILFKASFKGCYFIALSILLNLSCSTPHEESSYSNNEDSLSISFIDQYVLPNNLFLDSTNIGGLSSIDFAENKHWYLISDDRSEYSPARFYKAHIEYDEKKIETVKIEAVTLLKNEKGELYHSQSMDPEAIRYNNRSKTLFYASEGGRTKGNRAPFIREMDTLGNILKTFDIPGMFNYYENKGLRENGGFESLAFENDTIIWFANELPLIEDSEVPVYGGGKTPIRLTKFDIKNDKLLAEYAYHIEPVQAESIPKEDFSINSVTELISLNSKNLLVLERSYITGVGNYVKIFKIDISKATDISTIESLKEESYMAVQKELFIDFSDYNKRIDNVEGMAFGKDLGSGYRSLLCVSDNNFNDKQETQFWLFKIPKKLLGQ